jgi:hypothetical protein
MVALIGVVVLALLAHETTHWLILRRSETSIRLAILTPKPRLLMSLGLGWSYDPRFVSREVRSLSYLCAPLVELGVWLGGAAVLLLLAPASSEGLGCAGMGLGMIAGNWWLPYGDGAGWRRVHRETIADEEKAKDEPARRSDDDDRGMEPSVEGRSVIDVAGRVSHWPGVGRHDHAGTKVGPTARP